jgi:hypothetical protein
MSFSCWSGAWRRWWGNLSLMGPLFFLFFSIFSPNNYKAILFVIDISISVPILFIYDFCSWRFCKNTIYFQFHPSILICYIYIFSIWPLFFWFLIFFIGFCKSYNGLQIHHSIQSYGILIIFFNLVLILLVFFFSFCSSYFSF